MLLIAMMIIVIITSTVVCIAAPLPPDGSYSSPPLPGGSQNPSYPPGYSGSGNQQYPPGPPGQPGQYPTGPGNQQYPSGQGQNNQDNTNNQQNFVNHPSTGPSAGQQPQNIPAASTGLVAQNLPQGQALTNQQLAQFGGVPQTSNAGAGGQAKAYLLVTGLEQWAYYMGQWTKGDSAVYYNGYMNILVNNDQGQVLWSYELYPNGYVDWHNWGYLYPGYYNRLFYGDVPGWHQVAVWGSQSGWSNVLWIYVYP